MAGPSGETPTLKLPFPLEDDTVDVPRDVRALAESLDDIGLVPVGALMMWLPAVPPARWLICDGTQVPAATWPQLATVLGQSGGNITLPNLAARMPVGAGAGTPLGSVGGVATVALTENQLPLHTHAMGQAGDHSHGGKTFNSDRSLTHEHYPYSVPYFVGANYAIATTPEQGQFNANTRTPVIVSSDPNTVFAAQDRTSSNWTPDHLHGIAASGTHAHTLNGTGANDAHPNMPPYLAVNFIIRAG